MGFIYVLGVNGGTYPSPSGPSGNTTVINSAVSHLPISTNTIILIFVLAILIIGFLLYRKHLKSKYG